MSADDVVVIARRFRGPPESANGGYACGLLGKHLHAGARVRLRQPPPLDEPLTVHWTSTSALELVRAEETIAQATGAELSATAPEPVSFDAAVGATKSYPWFTGHPFPSCFVCGPERQAGDGLCIFPGHVAGRSVVAAPWVPHASVCDTRGAVHPEVVWAVLDCPSWFGVLAFEAGATVALLGQLTARLYRRPTAGEQCVVTGWASGRDGRKLFGGAAVYAPDGSVLGISEAVWIAPKT